MLFTRNPKKFLLLAHPTGSTIPIGTHNWEVGSKAAVCDKRQGDWHELTFSICYPDKYTCNDGSCIGGNMVANFRDVYFTKMIFDLGRLTRIILN